MPCVLLILIYTKVPHCTEIVRLSAIVLFFPIPDRATFREDFANKAFVSMYDVWAAILAVCEHRFVRGEPSCPVGAIPMLLPPSRSSSCCWLSASSPCHCPFCS